jgi:hypothetical protein
MWSFKSTPKRYVVLFTSAIHGIRICGQRMLPDDVESHFVNQ